MRYRCHVPDSGNVDPGTLQRTDSCLAAAARAFNEYLYLPEAVHHRLPCGVAGGHLRCVGSAFREPLKPAVPELPQDKAFPWGSVRVTMVLLKVDCT